MRKELLIAFLNIQLFSKDYENFFMILLIFNVMLLKMRKSVEEVAKKYCIVSNQQMNMIILLFIKLNFR